MVSQIGQLLERKELRASTVMRIDATGVGRAVVDMFMEAYRDERMGDLRPEPITITSGAEGDHWRAPKTDLVAGQANYPAIG